MLVVSALTGAAVLRTGARVFLQLGPPLSQDEPGHEAQADSEVETDEAHAATPVLARSCPPSRCSRRDSPWGLVPGLTHSLMGAAARFTDHSGYARTVLFGIPATPAVPATRGPSGLSYVYGVGATVAAIAVAALALYVHRLPRPATRALAGLRALHSGRVGDYVAWLAVGVATIGGALTLTLR